MDCPTFESLVDFADGRLVRQEAAAIERHLETCQACAGAVDWHRAFAATAREDTSFDPPEWVTRRAVDLFAEAREAASRRGVRGLLNRLRAVLVFDSLAGELSDAIPARSAAAETVGADRRQLLYSVPPYDIDLLVTRTGVSERLAIAGQILVGEDSEFDRVGGLRVELVREGEPIAVAETSEFGEFSLEDLPVGTYEVRFFGEGREIVVSEAPLILA